VYNFVIHKDFQDKDYLWDLKQTVSCIFQQLDMAVDSISSNISIKQEKTKELTTQRKKKSSKSSRSTNFGKDNATDHDTSFDTLPTVKVYEVPLEM
jgi:hypothetical protein